MKMESESVDAVMRGGRTLFTGFVARMEDTRLPNCVMFERVMRERAAGEGGGVTVDGVPPG